MNQLEWKYNSLAWFTRSDFRIQFLLKFKEVTDASQHLYELKQCQLNIGSCKPTFREGNLTFKLDKIPHESLKFNTE